MLACLLSAQQAEVDERQHAIMIMQEQMEMMHELEELELAAAMAASMEEGGYSDEASYERLLQLEDVKVSAPQHVIDELATIRFDANAQNQYSSCQVCLAEFEQLQTLKVLPCKHMFHGECIEPWLGMSKVCPVCKQEICA